MKSSRKNTRVTKRASMFRVILNPNLKEGFGGLRDYHVALWAVAVRFGVLSFREIKGDEVVSQQEISRLEKSVNFTLRVRNELHYQTGKKGDVLTLDLQEPLARELGYRGEGRAIGSRKIHARIFSARHYHLPDI